VLEGTMTRDPAQRWSISDARAYLEDGANRSRPVAVRSGRRSRGAQPDDGGTTLMPSLATVPPPAPTPAQPMDLRARKRRPWALIVLLALALVVAMAVAFWVGLGDGDDAPKALPNTTSSSPSPSQTPSGTPSPSATPSAAEPDADAMVSFATSYVSSAVLDPQRAFDQLTPAYQQASGGFSGYRDNFWGSVTRARVLSATADPDNLTVSYTYRYVQRGTPHVEDVTLQLEFEDGRYLISGTA